jgi:hypothetical protein
MNRILWMAFVVFVVGSATGPARADDQAVKAVLDKAIKALGGEEKLARADTYVRKAKGTMTFNGNESKTTVEATTQGLEHFRSEFQGEFNGNTVRGVTVLDGDKGWRKFGDNKIDLDAAGVANEKRNVYLQVIPATLLPLTGKSFKVESAGEETINDKPAALLKVTGPDGKDFTIAFGKDTGLPVRVVARVIGFQGQEFTLETTYSDYREIDGIKRAMKIEVKRDGQTFVVQEVAEYKVLDKVDAQTFAEPQ